MLIDEKIIHNYVDLHVKIDQFFESTKIEKKHYIELMGWTRPTFNRKLKEKTMSAEEMLKLVRELNKVSVY